MPGGSVESYETLGPILASIAAVAEGEPCVTHVGTDGAGHFVKMIHNGIEYADMQLIAEAYDLLRTVGGLEPAADRGRVRRVEQGLPGVVPDRDHRRGAPPGGRGDRQAVRRHRPRPGRVQGHRGVDRAERPRPGRPGRRHRRGRVRPRRVLQARAARGRAGGRDSRVPRCRGWMRRSPTTCPRRCTHPRSSPTRKASTRSSPAPRSTAGTSTRTRSRRSGAAAASSAPSSSTGSPTPTTRTRTSPPCSRPRTSPTPSPRAKPPGAASSPPPHSPACRSPASAPPCRYYDSLAVEAPARRPRPGPARLLRRPHLQARRQGRHLPHPLVRRPHRDRDRGLLPLAVLPAHREVRKVAFSRAKRQLSQLSGWRFAVQQGLGACQVARDEVTLGG